MPRQPLDYVDEIYELDRRREFRRKCAGVMFWSCLAFIVIGNVWVWMSWR